MERLINHLQDTLDEDEAAKDALLLLRNKEHNCLGSESVDHINDKITKLLIFESTVAKIMDRCITSADLPLFIMAMKLDISVHLLRTICDTQTLYNAWPMNFLQYINQIISIFETAVLHNRYVPNVTQIGKLAQFKETLKEIQSGGCETDSVAAQFALNVIVEEVLARASALRLEASPSESVPLHTLEVDVTSLAKDQPSWIEKQNAVVVLAPLILQPRTAKHFIVPLIEPDITRVDEVFMSPKVGVVIDAAVCARGEEQGSAR